jgi:hypothetical protein
MTDALSSAIVVVQVSTAAATIAGTITGSTTWKKLAQRRHAQADRGFLDRIGDVVERGRRVARAEGQPPHHVGQHDDAPVPVSGSQPVLKLITSPMPMTVPDRPAAPPGSPAAASGGCASSPPGS